MNEWWCTMNQLEENVVRSFRLAKNDIIKVQKDVIDVSQAQERLIERIESLHARQAALEQKLKAMDGKKEKAIEKKTVVMVSKKAKKIYVAPKTGKTFHISDCPFAQNIKPKNKLVFHSKTRALNKGFKPCKCVR